VIDGDFDPLRRRPTTKTKGRRKLDNPAKLSRHDVNNRVSFSHSGAMYSTANHGVSSPAIPVVLIGSPQWVMSLGTKIKAARAEAKLTQQQVADALDITKGSVSQWETNETTPTLNQFRAFCALTSASADALLLDRQLRGLEKRIGALPDALREYVMQALQLAETAKPRIPTRFLTPPTKQTYQAFHQYLVELSETIRPKT
jgi:transcriptional regulator with XRE-family HTH domain